MTTENEYSRPKFQFTFGNVVQLLQLVALLAGVAGLFLAVGRRDAEFDAAKANISGLTAVVQNLTLTSTNQQLTLAVQSERIGWIMTTFDKWAKEIDEMKNRKN
jgi:hypothetical protein